MGNQTVSTLPVHTNLSPYACTTETGIYQHRASRALVEKCDMQQQSHFQILSILATHHRFLPRAYGLVAESSQSWCSGVGPSYAMVEYLPYRLHDVGALTYHQAIYILYHSLHALQVLHPLFPCLLLDDDCIAFTSEGRCKVWASGHLVRGKPAKARSHQHMVEEALHLVERRMNLTEEERQEYQAGKKKCGRSLTATIQFVEGLMAQNKVGEGFLMEVPKLSYLQKQATRWKISLKKKRKGSSTQENTPNILQPSLSQLPTDRKVAEHNLHPQSLIHC